MAAIQAHVEHLLGDPVFSRTIRRRLVKGYLRSRLPLRVLSLTPNHRGLRLECYRARANRIAVEWNKFVVSDKSRFNLSSDDNRARLSRSLPQLV
ncbi:transposable element Tcb2 transposase [Trichonephila clavipes]|nr:transposable element Tcb2 transposase [Trichonephila clavipes]